MNKKWQKKDLVTYLSGDKPGMGTTALYLPHCSAQPRPKVHQSFRPEGWNMTAYLYEIRLNKMTDMVGLKLKFTHNCEHIIL